MQWHYLVSIMSSSFNVKIGVLWWKVLPLNQIKKKYVFIQLFDLLLRWGPTGLSKSSKKGQFPGSVNKSWEFGWRAFRLEGDHQTLTFGFMQLFDTKQPWGLWANENLIKGVLSQVCNITIGNFWVMNKTRLEGGFMQLFDLMQPWGPAGSSISV